MSKATKIWLIVAASLVALGIVLLVWVFTMIKWDFKKLSTNKYETNKYEIEESYNSLSIDTDTANIVFLPSDSSKCIVECHEQKNAKHSVAVKEDTLVIELVDQRHWYEHIGVNFENSSITVYLPQGEYASLDIKNKTGGVEIPDGFRFEKLDISVSTGSVECRADIVGAAKIKSTTGDICVKNVSAGSLTISVSTGKVTVTDVSCDRDVFVRVSTGRAYLTNVKCGSFASEGSTGDIFLNQVIAAEKLSVERDTGDVNLERCDAAEIFIETETGDVVGSLLSEKVFLVETDTGRVDLPRSTSGGRCEISTSTGDIEIEIK